MDPNLPTGETMNEGSAPDNGGYETPEQEMSENQVCVPLNALDMPDEKDEMQSPGVGDKVTMNVEGTVDRVDGKNAYVTMHAVNGQELEPDQDEEATQEQGLRQDIGNLPEGY